MRRRESEKEKMAGDSFPDSHRFSLALARPLFQSSPLTESLTQVYLQRICWTSAPEHIVDYQFEVNQGTVEAPGAVRLRQCVNTQFVWEFKNGILSRQP